MDNKVKDTKKSEIFSVSNIITALVLVLVLVAAIVLVAVNGAKPIVIPDENGEEDFSLAVLTESDISAKEPKFSCNVYGVLIDDDASGVNDSDKIVAHAQAELSGVAVLQKTVCEAEKVTFTVNCERTKGNIRVMLLDEKRNVIHDFEVGASSSFTLENAKGKTFELRIAAESAEFKVTTERTFG
jgi:hypothetical protein